MAYTAIDRVYSIFIDVMTGVSSGSGSATFYNTDNHTSFIELTVTNGNQLFDMTAYTYILVVSKPSKQTYKNEYTTTDKSKLVIALDSQMLADSGSNKGQLFIMKTVDNVDKVLTMVEFNYLVKDGSYNELAPESINHDALYIKLRNDVDSILSKIENGEIGGGSGGGLTPTQKEQLTTAYNHAMSDAVTTTDEVNSAIATYVEANKASLKGDKGDKGENGTNGKDGVTPNITIGTVTTVKAGGNATASISGTTSNLVLNLGIPKGTDGTNGTVDSSNYYNKTEINTKLKNMEEGLIEVAYSSSVQIADSRSYLDATGDITVTLPSYSQRYTDTNPFTCEHHIYMGFTTAHTVTFADTIKWQSVPTIKDGTVIDFIFTFVHIDNNTNFWLGGAIVYE